MTLYIVYLVPVSLCEWSMLWSIYERGFLENFCNYTLGQPLAHSRRLPTSLLLDPSGLKSDPLTTGFISMQNGVIDMS